MKLRPASLKDRKKVYEWLVASDATPFMMGPPRFQEHPITPWHEFCLDYTEDFFTSKGNGFGRVFIINTEGRDIGCINYDGLKSWQGIAELDIWIASSADWGKGYGSTALKTLSQDLLTHPGVDTIIIRPSKRNPRAIAAYQRAGFVLYNPVRHTLPHAVLSTGLDYEDVVVLIMTRNECLKPG